ncbi:MAG TPA: MBL fold metallo-hydrolase [Thermoanaerobaculia bacterium]|nr:MBL fold metallo-hydrolase [Thermoanaerobaculia bacterium]
MRALKLLCLALALGSIPAWAQNQDYSKVQIQTVAVAPGISMLLGAGGNIGVSVGEDGVFLIDDQYAPLTEKIQAAVKALSPKPVRFLLNTHWHGDHTGGNENLGKAGAMIVAHDNVRIRLSTEQFMPRFNEKVPPSPAIALPVVTYNDSVTFHVNGEEIYAFHVPPAHTDGDSIVFFRKANVVHMGDVFFNGLYPFIDVDSGGSISGVIAAVDRVLAMVGDDVKLIPGHGPLAGKKELAAYRAMLAAVRDNVAKLVAAGKSEADVLAAKPTAAFDETWGKGFLKPEVFTQIVFASVSKEAGKKP